MKRPCQRLTSPVCTVRPETGSGRAEPGSGAPGAQGRGERAQAGRCDLSVWLQPLLALLSSVSECAAAGTSPSGDLGVTKGGVAPAGEALLTLPCSCDQGHPVT